MTTVWHQVKWQVSIIPFHSMRLRQSSERRPPRRYEGDGTYGHGDSLHSSEPACEHNGGCLDLFTPSNARRQPHDNNKSSALLHTSSTQSHSISQVILTPSPTSTLADRRSHSPRSRLKMANIRYVRLNKDKKQPPQERPRRPRVLAVKSEGDYIPQQLLDRSTLRSGKPESPVDRPRTKPAAFPSLPIGKTCEVIDSGKHGLARLMEEREGGDPQKIKKSFQRIDAHYDGMKCPADLSDMQKTWFPKLKYFLDNSNNQAKVREPQHYSLCAYVRPHDRVL